MAKIIKSLCLSPEAEAFVNKHILNFSKFVEEAISTEMLKFNAGDSKEALNALIAAVYPIFFERRYKSASMARNYVTGASVVSLIKKNKVKITPLELYDILNDKFEARLKQLSRNTK